MGEEDSARFLDYFAIFLARISGIFVNNPPPKPLRTSLPANNATSRGRRSFLVVMAASRRSRQRPLPLRRGGHGGGLCPFVVVGHGGGLFFTPTQKQRKNRFTCDFRLFIAGTCLGFAPLRGTCAVRRFFRRNRRKKGEKTRKKATSTGRGRWSFGGLRRAALEVTAVFCGHGRWLWAAVFLGFSIWRLKRHNP